MKAERRGGYYPSVAERARGPARAASTTTLLNRIFRAPSVEKFIETNSDSLDVPTFSEYITGLSRKRGEVPERVIRRAMLERSFGHQLFKGRRNPSRDTVIMLAFGFELDVKGAQELLRIAQMSALYPRVKRDAIAIYCLHNGLGVVETQLMLSRMGLPELGRL